MPEKYFNLPLPFCVYLSEIQPGIVYVSFLKQDAIANQEDELEDKTVIHINVTPAPTPSNDRLELTENLANVQNNDQKESLLAATDVLLEQENYIVMDTDFELAPQIRGDGDGTTEECGFQIKELKIGDKGVIQTPNYPDNYPPDIQCIWWLKVI